MSLRFALAGVLLPVLMAACGGGTSGGAAVTTLSASGLAYGRSMTVTASGSGLNDSGLQMTVDGPCSNSTRSSGATDSQVQFTCTVDGVGMLSPRIRNALGEELARVTVTVPTPLVSVGVSQGAQSGTLVIELDPAAAPVTVSNFMAYVTAGFYRDTLIHRVVPGKLAQGGGYSAGPVPKPPTRGAIELESNNGLRNLRGTIAMARTSVPNSATSQFYLNISDNPEFDRVSDSDPGYAVFGRVLIGAAVLDEIGRVETRFLNAGLPELPLVDVVVTSVLQIR
ncbi:MAG: peptidylprolyl isomerase [Chitinophagaceae bacterium]|nr:peptidylprolyl isomerase [Rubrivivax sp.]